MSEIKGMLRNAGMEIWENLPAWYVYIGVTSLTFSYISLTPVQRYGRATTFIFPLILFFAFYLSRIYTDSTIAEKRKKDFARNLLLGLSVNMILIFLLAFPVRLGDTLEIHLKNYKLYFELTVLLVEFLIGIHCYLHRRKRDFFMFIIPALIYGFFLESGGVTMGFFFENHYSVYLPFFNAPLVTMLGWSSTFYITVFMCEKIMEALPRLKKGKSLLLSIFLVPFSALLIDLQLDPFATEMGLWKWNPVLYREGADLILGVPLLNFFAWFGAVFSFGLFYFMITAGKFSRYGELKKAALMTMFIPVILLFAGLIIFSLAGIYEGFNGPTWTILKDYFNSGMATL